MNLHLGFVSVGQKQKALCLGVTPLRRNANGAKPCHLMLLPPKLFVISMLHLLSLMHFGLVTQTCALGNDDGILSTRSKRRHVVGIPDANKALAKM